MCFSVFETKYRFSVCLMFQFFVSKEPTKIKKQGIDKMTTQEKKQYLSRYLDSKKRFDCISDRMLHIRQMAERIRSVISEESDGSLRLAVQVERTISQLELCAEELEQEAVRMRRTMKEIRSVIDTVPDESLRLLLELRYLSGYTLEETAERMNYSCRHVSRLHEAALQKIDVVCPPEKQ